MTPWQNRATELTRRMADDMMLRNSSQRTITARRILMTTRLPASKISHTARDRDSCRLSW